MNQTAVSSAAKMKSSSFLFVATALAAGTAASALSCLQGIKYEMTGDTCTDAVQAIVDANNEDSNHFPWTDMTECNSGAYGCQMTTADYVCGDNDNNKRDGKCPNADISEFPTGCTVKMYMAFCVSDCALADAETDIANTNDRPSLNGATSVCTEHGVDGGASSSSRLCWY